MAEENFTLKAFKMPWHIISTSPKQYTLKVVSIAVCEECRARFVDDDSELDYGRFLCEGCRNSGGCREVMCENCQVRFLYDDSELEYGKFLCETCTQFENKTVSEI